ncbi:MAG: hypothetical protein K2V38_25095 [Gemmataceae bacterium]|nr:hypothetical protein [Gemmataceae bacterium]
MRANRDGKAVVPGNGGYDIEVVEVTGPPDRMMAVPPAKSRGRLIPMGTGEDLRSGPGAFLRKRVPLVPTHDEIARLPRGARVAFAARCARRVLPSVVHFWKSATGRCVLSLTSAVETAERAAAGSAPASVELACATDAVRPIAASARTDARGADGAVARIAIDAIRAAASGTASATAEAAAETLFKAATTDTPLTAQLRCIRRDFALLKRLAREQKWTDDTPVPPDVFGPMWPPGVAPYWAVEPPPTRS